MTKHQLISMLSSVDFICREQVAFAGGSDKFTDLLTSVIESAGGEVHTNEGR